MNSFAKGHFRAIIWQALYKQMEKRRLHAQELKLRLEWIRN